MPAIATVQTRTPRYNGSFSIFSFPNLSHFSGANLILLPVFTKELIFSLIFLFRFSAFTKIIPPTHFFDIPHRFLQNFTHRIHAIIIKVLLYSFKYIFRIF